MGATTTVAKAPKTAGELTLAPARPVPFRVADNAVKAPTGPTTFVARGVQVKVRPGQEPIKVLVHVDGSSMQAIPLAFVGAAITHGVITDEEIAYLKSLKP